VRAYLDADLHEALKIFADIDGVTEADFIERIVVPILRRRIADATVAAELLARAGITRTGPDKPGKGRA
jgi:ABC-type maltose transport system permease subunit